MHRVESARNRSRAYVLLAELYARGVQAADVAVLRAVDSLARHVGEPFDADDAAADHYAVLSIDVLPYAGVYLEPDGRAAGATADRIQRFAAQAGFALEESSYSADHVSIQFQLVAQLLRAEAEALGDGRDSEAERARALQHRMLVEHVITWTPPFLEALTAQPLGFYRALSQLTTDVLIDHLDDVHVEDGIPGPVYIQPVEPAAVDALLDSGETGVKDIAEFLTTPSASGIYLSPGDIARLARRDDLPRGFGSRRQTLVNLFRSAAEYDRVEELIDGLLERIAQCRAYYRRIGEEGSGRMGVEPWMARLTATEQLAERMRTTVASAAAE